MNSFKSIHLLALFSLLCLSGCSTYPSKFKGDPAKGTWGAMPMDVDIMVNNGEVDLIYRNSKMVRDYENRDAFEPSLRQLDVSNIMYEDDCGAE